MPLDAAICEPGCQGATTANFDHVTHFIGTSRLAHQTDRHLFALLRHVIQNSGGAVQGWPLFIAGHGDQDRPIWRGVFDQIHGRCDKGRDAAFHVGGPATIENSVFDVRAKGIDAPGVCIANGHDIGVTIEAKGFCMTLLPPTRHKVGHFGPIRAADLKTCLSQQIP